VKREHSTYPNGGLYGVDAYRYPSGLIVLTLCLGRHRWAVAFNV